MRAVLEAAPVPGTGYRISRTLYNLESFTFPDLVKTDETIFILGSQLNGSGNHFQNPESTKVFERHLYIIQISKNGSIRSKIMASDTAIATGALSVCGRTITAFYSFKPMSSFAMNGALTISERDTLHTRNTKKIFTNRNWRMVSDNNA